MDKALDLHKKSIKELLGNIEVSNNSKLQERMRIHQGWWRMAVLEENEGQHPLDKEMRVCSSIENGELNGHNFLSEDIHQGVIDFLKSREANNSKTKKANGIAKVDRLYNNLLSSQPLCFNFFVKLARKKELATQLLQSYLPNIKEVKNVLFEYAPLNWTFDNSAFDVAFEVIDQSGKKGLIGLECKYTDDFSRKVYNSAQYQEIYNQGQAFSATYEDYMNPRFNQLFRNHLMAVHAVVKDEYDFAVSGLFYFHEDKKARDIGLKFRSMLKGDAQEFIMFTYKDFIENLQKLDLSWDEREWTMLLWARYCACQLSNRIFDSLKS